MTTPPQELTDDECAGIRAHVVGTFKSVATTPYDHYALIRAGAAAEQAKMGEPVAAPGCTWPHCKCKYEDSCPKAAPQPAAPAAPSAEPVANISDPMLWVCDRCVDMPSMAGCAMKDCQARYIYAPQPAAPAPAGEVVWHDYEQAIWMLIVQGQCTCTDATTCGYCVIVQRYNDNRRAATGADGGTK